MSIDFWPSLEIWHHPIVEKSEIYPLKMQPLNFFFFEDIDFALKKIGKIWYQGETRFDLDTTKLEFEKLSS